MSERERFRDVDVEFELEVAEDYQWFGLKFSDSGMLLDILEAAVRHMAADPTHNSQLRANATNGVLNGVIEELQKAGFDTSSFKPVDLAPRSRSH